MYGLETIQRLNAQKSGDFSYRTDGARYTIAEVDGQRRTYLNDSEIPVGARILERVG